MWDWTVPHLEFFTLGIAFITIGMKETETILAMALPVLIVSIFTTPFVSIAVGYLILILVYKNEEVGRTPWLTEEIESWKLFKWSFRVVWGLMVLMSISLLLAEFGINVGV
ncbi:hypothetical protein AKJ65_07815 [candidate division MSBL1 archaeon SCGC-AAA259E19]|uniref:Uncharacterized protein n=1 Tax=candidate division MSBL1 archaeon SCGC-AAA259E19 TaxID=1698264 RepID=A0A133UDL8_9EURY|nr:hypothetical protein AKJ65_07815 [candidate division MSBL1 archaeon SCGC-AAA259E19]